MQIVGRKGGGKGGGGGGGGRIPVEAPDSLRSKQYAKFVEVISCGEIQGPVNGAKSVYFGDVPLQNDNGTYNFKDVAIEWRNGSVRQRRTSIGNTIETTTDINTEVKQAYPIVRAISAEEADFARISIKVPRLTSQNKSNGDVNGATVELKVEYQPDGGGWINAGTIKISGKTTSTYSRTHSFNLSGNAPWNVRVTRLTQDANTATIQNQTIWATLTTGFYEKLIYPSTAYVAVQIDAEQFSSIPTRAYDCKGIKVRVPSNYNPVTRAYSGDWNGQFKVAWTDNPVWIYYDLITNELYGAGEYIKDSMLDKWSLYQIARYCDEYVPNGFGGWEPRFTCNVYLQTREEAYKLLKDLASAFRAMSYWASGTLALVQDAPKDPVYQFNNTNVVNGTFTRAGSNIKTRHNVALVTWNDPNNMFKQAVEYVEDAEAIVKMGYVSETEVVAFGCTSRGQARRVGKWLLFTEQYESEVVTFSVGQDGVIPMPGDIIQVSDVHRAGERMGGRVKEGSTTSTILLDTEITLESGKNYILCLINNNGNLEQRNINTRGTVSRVTVNSTFSSIAPGSTWIISKADLLPELYRVVAIAENSDSTFTISAVDHNPSKYNYIERDWAFRERDTSNLTLNTGVRDVVITDEIYKGMGNTVLTRIVVSYAPATSTTSRYQLSYREGNGNWITLQITNDSTIEIPNVKDSGNYQIKIDTANVLGTWTKATTTYTYRPIGKLRPPNNVTGLDSYILPQEGCFVRWDMVPDIDLDHYEVRTGLDFATSELVAKVKANELNAGFITSGTHRFWVTAVDSSNISSLNPQFIDVTVNAGNVPTLNAEIVGEEVLLTWQEVTNNSFATEMYEVRRDDSVIATVKSTSFKFKADYSGNAQYSVTAIDLGGNRSEAANAELVIYPPNTVQISQQVIDNYVMLKWTNARTSLPIVYYELYKGDDFTAAELLTRIDGLAFPQFETKAGRYKYWVRAVDSAGNRAVEQLILANVSEPPDYILKYDYNSEYGGTFSNARAINNNLYLPINTTQTWRQHYEINGFTSPQSQVNAGYPLYLQPTEQSGSYEETIDYGTILASSKITITPKVISKGSYKIAYYIAVRGAETEEWREHTEASIYETKFRYLKFRITITAANEPVIIDDINIKLDQKLKTDGGTVYANKNDVNGTWVDFRVPFIDAGLPVLTPQATVPMFAVSNFKDEPYPTGFYVFLFDKDGNRASGNVGWVVKGV
ncbi:TipJ family phage tail tip protein [Gallibacterium genomosp. 3]|uniref:Phage tail protein n=1 Tax=Gallibacterium genomosp. 3 TaxID=505345 RepID=A0A1A7QD70_9PAST|nr:phage tail protein [Gallibacterium genomosp. 3]OBX11365.1 phage tail protein [Gallibacterium genomosp. 3]